MGVPGVRASSCCGPWTQSPAGQGFDWTMIFADRSDAGRRLAERLLEYRRRRDVLVLALPRGGVPVAYELASALEAPLDVFVVRKLGLPGQPEVAMGAIASGGALVLNPGVVYGLDVPSDVLQSVVAR